MNEELKIEEVTLMSKLKECIFQFNKEMEALIVKQKQENRKNMIMNSPNCYWSTIISSSEQIEEGITNQSVVGRVKLDSIKMEQLLRRQPKLNNVSFSLYKFVF